MSVAAEGGMQASGMTNGVGSSNHPMASGKRKRDSVDGERSESTDSGQEQRSAKRQSVSLHSPMPLSTTRSPPMAHSPSMLNVSATGHQPSYLPSLQKPDSNPPFYATPYSNGVAEVAPMGLPPTTHGGGSPLHPNLPPAANHPYPLMGSSLASHQQEYNTPDRPTPSHHYDESMGSRPNPFSALDNNENKPSPGTEEWHRQRKDNHKEVERRRRETINEGINELAKIVPNCEKNKGLILQSAVTYINHLRDKSIKDTEHWQLEKMVNIQAVQEMKAHGNNLKAELESVIRQRDAALKNAEKWRKMCAEAGLDTSGDASEGQGEAGQAAEGAVRANGE